MLSLAVGVERGRRAEIFRERTFGKLQLAPATDLDLPGRRVLLEDELTVLHGERQRLGTGRDVVLHRDALALDAIAERPFVADELIPSPDERSFTVGPELDPFEIVVASETRVPRAVDAAARRCDREDEGDATDHPC